MHLDTRENVHCVYTYITTTLFSSNFNITTKSVLNTRSNVRGGKKQYAALYNYKCRYTTYYVLLFPY